MSDTQSERVAVPCPSCSPGDATVHEVLKPGGQSTVRCSACGHTHKVAIESAPAETVDVVVSQEGESVTTSIEGAAGDVIETGDAFVVDTPEALYQVEVTSIELGPEARTDRARLDEIEAVWTRVVDNVGVNVTIHPADGTGDGTRSRKMRVPGDYEFVVGETESVGDEEFEVTGVQVRDDANYRFDKLDRDGDMAFAKDVKRVYGRDRSSRAWSPW
jgi:uncharacterized Zn finger protein